ncbi:putative Blue copper protein [Cocos nucifera]|uniref:Putative Blue copper protein n=1 Tax=Cocos nucifera TaxID=13894 RepID=A0A8K0I8H2_COCNU|nr:putative Blue copper protein [Cocos nucifera]
METTGPATIELNSTGTRYYICTIPGHCGQGMKLEVTVGSSSGSPSTPPPPPTSTTPTATPPSPTSTGNNSAAPGLVPASTMVSLTGLVVLLF